MNLQDILSYRDRCIHCDRPLVMHITRYPKLLITQNDEGLLIKSKNANGLFLDFKFDGKYGRSKRNYEIHKGPIYVKKYCHFHPLFDDYKGVSLDSIKDTTCCYIFSLFGDAQGNYSTNMEYEGIAWHDDLEFWHLNTFYSDNITHVYHGLYSKKIGDVMHLTLPIMDLSSIKDQNQYLKKLKLYTLFS